MAKNRGLERTPPAAMNEDRQRRVLVPLGQEQIDRLPRRAAIGQAELGTAVFEHLGPIKLRFSRPAGKNLGMFGHAGAIVIFNFVVDRGHRRLLKGLRGESAACLARWQVGRGQIAPAEIATKTGWFPGSVQTGKTDGSEGAS